jgi:sensor histidine kinase YesM
MTVMEPVSYPLNRSLPAEVLVGGNAVWSRYRQYPVFSWPWLRGRSLLFASIIAVVSLLIGMGVGLASRSIGLGALVMLLEFGAFILMATAGPAFATWARHRHWPLRRERAAIVLAAILGIAVSAVTDWWASAEIKQLMQPMLSAMKPPAQSELGAVQRIVALTINLVTLLLIYGLFGGGLALRAYFSEQRRWQRHQDQQALDSARRQAQEADLKLGVLQAQVEPHFLFNTLASVRALVRQDPAQAEGLLDALVDFLRATIPLLRDGQAAMHSTLGQQLDICHNYLELMRLRMGRRLDFSIRAEPALRQCSFPPALLITLVENAVKHGIEPKRGRGQVEILATQSDGQLRVQVIDNGIGLQPGLGSGMGLINVREQLAHRFGDKAALILSPLPEYGLCAEVVIPQEAA